MQALLKAALACHKVYDTVSIPDSTVGQQVNVRNLAVDWLDLIENLSKGLIDSGATEVSLKRRDLVYSEAHILVVVLDTTLVKHELVARAIAADIEFAASWETVKEKDESFSRHLDGIVHGATAIDQEDVLLAAQVLHFIVILLHLQGFFPLCFKHLLLFFVAAVLDTRSQVEVAKGLGGKSALLNILSDTLLNFLRAGVWNDLHAYSLPHGWCQC